MKNVIEVTMHLLWNNSMYEFLFYSEPPKFSLAQTVVITSIQIRVA